MLALERNIIRAGLSSYKIWFRLLYLWSADISRAYRQLRVCPLSLPLLGLSINEKFFLDLAPPSGCLTSALVCARTTRVVVWLVVGGWCRNSHIIKYPFGQGSVYVLKHSIRGPVTSALNLLYGRALPRKKVASPLRSEWHENSSGLRPAQSATC